MFFTFWGLKAIQSGAATGSSTFGRLLGLMNRGGLNRIGPSRLNMGGLGRWMFKRMIARHQVVTLPQLRQMAIDLGVRFWPCQMSMEVMEIGRESLIPEVQEPAGVAAFVEQAGRSQVTLFI